MNYKLIGKHFSVSFSLIFFSFSRYNVCKKMLEKEKCDKRTAKKLKPLGKLTFWHALFLENEEKTSEKILKRNVFLSICGSHAKN